MRGLIEHNLTGSRESGGDTRQRCNGLQPLLAMPFQRLHGETAQVGGPVARPGLFSKGLSGRVKELLHQITREPQPKSSDLATIAAHPLLPPWDQYTIEQ